MRKVLVPVSAGNSAQMQSAVAEAIAIYRDEPVEIHLLNVQVTVPRYVAGFFKASDLHRIHEEAGQEELEPAKAMLEAAGIAFKTHVLVGRNAETIVQAAHNIGADRILMGDAGQHGFSGKLFGTVASQVRHLVNGADGADGAGNCQVIGS